MKLHRLRLAALGPFASEFDIDLAAVCAGGLFLLEGPTGAGKSTILDAITFALYGGVAGRATSKDRLHSDFSSELDPLAELDFSIGGSRYRVRRSPTFERAKRDGSGTTVVNSKVWLWRLSGGESGEWVEELISNRVREADDEVRRLLGGLSLEQFCQVVVLPQGEFATFLRADAEQRRDVLQRLFATDHYQQMEKIAAEKRVAAQHQLDEVNQHLRDAVVSLRQAVGEQTLVDAASFDVDLVLGLSEVDRHVWIESLTAQTESAYDHAANLDQEAELALESARADYDAILAKHDRRREHIEHERERVRLMAMSEQMADEIRVRDRAIRVQALTPMFDERDRIAFELSSAQAMRVQHHLVLGDDESIGLTGDAESAEVLELIERLRVHQAQLAPALAVEEGIAQQRQERDEELIANAAHKAEQAAFAEAVDALPVRLAELVKERDQLRVLTARVPDLVQGLAQAQHRWDAWQRLDGLDREVAELEDRVRAMVDQSQNARDALQRATEYRLAGMAAELASTLTQGEACVVCGSTDHPHPAVSSGVRVSEDELDALTQTADATARERQDAESARNDKLIERERCRADAGQADPSEDLQRLTAQLAEAQAAARELPDCESACLECQRELDQARSGLTTAEVNIAASTQRINERVQAVTQSESIIESARAEHASVAERVQTIAHRLTAAQQWARSCADVEAYQQRLLTISQAIDTAARDCGCSDADDAQSAIRTPEDLASLNQTIAEYERLSAVNAAALIAYTEAEAVEELPDLSAAEGRRAEAIRRSNECRAARTAAEITLKEVNSCALAISAAAQAIVDLDAKTAATIRVADALGGLGRVNSRRMTLSTYVLRERFASVVEAASRRLDRMSDGRYALERDEAVSGNRKAGLGLVVLDQWNGARRDPRTLSGGESFYASLSLALGLADVVRDEAGGVELDTLFIDEGFGSLDPQALESVLGVIDSLRDGGRVVGIVSHVSELKERIPDRIIVRRLTDGSSTVSIRAT